MATIIFDIETGPVAEEQLRAIYREPTWDEFCESCDQRWKPETRQAKYEEAKASGWQKFVDRAALSPITGQVLAVGLLKDGQDPVILGEEEEPEEEQLVAFWKLFTKYRNETGRMVGFNNHGFDVPFLIRRSWFHQIPVPDSVFDSKTGYLCSVFVDLMRVWSCSPRGGEFISLDRLARFFGIGAKPDDVGGADFARLWTGSPEERALALGYLRNDLGMTLNLAKRMGVIL